MTPFVVQESGGCQECEVPFASSCSSPTTARTCIDGYYVIEGRCSSCLLNCVECSSSSDCRGCVEGFYLNSTVLTCNPCPANCLSCNPNAPSICASCVSNFVLVGGSCNSVLCNVQNCYSCSAANQCAICAYGYYLNGINCLPGGGALCLQGGTGPGPSSCQ